MLRNLRQKSGDRVMQWLERLRSMEVIVIATVLIGVGASAVLGVYTIIGPIDERSKKTEALVSVTQAEVAAIRSRLLVTDAKADDALDARLEYVQGQIGKLEAKVRNGGQLTPTERDWLRLQIMERDRLRKLRYGVRE